MRKFTFMYRSRKWGSLLNILGIFISSKLLLKTLSIFFENTKGYYHQCNYIHHNSFDKIKIVVITAKSRKSPTGNYMFKINNRNTTARCEICSKLTAKTPERRSGVFIVNFEYISHLVLVFLLLTLSR